MSLHIAQANYNLELYKSLCKDYPNDFPDWKITVLFYCCYHYIKALADKRKVNIGDRHTDIMWNINPNNRSRILQVKKDVFNSYDRIFTYSWTARYDGFLDLNIFLTAKKSDLKDAEMIHDYIRAYVISSGVKL